MLNTGIHCRKPIHKGTVHGVQPPSDIAEDSTYLIRRQNDILMSSVTSHCLRY